MLDIHLIRENPEKLRQNLKDRQMLELVGEVERLLELDEKRRELIQKVEQLKAKQNALSSEIGRTKDKGLVAEASQLKEKIQELEPQLVRAEEELNQLLWQMPNWPKEDVSVGKDESENVIVRQWGEPAQFAFQAREHLSLGEKLGLIDVQRAAKVSGSRFSYLKADLVLLEFALIRLAFDTLLPEGFVPVLPPVLIKKEMMQGMGYLEHGGEQEMYILGEDNLVVVGTSEQSIGPMHAGEVLEGKSLPLRYLGFSSCFRREAGSYGQDTRGILRVHQFNKVEMFSFTRPQDSDAEHEYLLALEEKLLQALEISYRVVKMCTGDLGAPAARKYDLEAWLPGQGQYREVTSTSTTTDFQARRLNIKYKGGGKADYVHMLNGTAFSERPLIAILENYQQKDGSVRVPKVLQEYVGKKVIL